MAQRLPRCALLISCVASLMAATKGCRPFTVSHRAATAQVVATRWAALLEGELTLDGSCLRVVAGGENWLLAWPPEYEARVEGGEVRITDRAGRLVVWHIGQHLRLGGGAIEGEDPLDPGRSLTVPAGCTGPYWVVGDLNP